MGGYDADVVRSPLPKRSLRVRLANYTVLLEVPEGVPEATLDHLCQVLDLIDLRERLQRAAAFVVETNRVLSPYVRVTAEE
jgi:hypothetical protein